MLLVYMQCHRYVEPKQRYIKGIDTVEHEDSEAAALRPR